MAVAVNSSFLLISLLFTVTLILIPKSKAANSLRYSFCPNTTLFNPKNDQYQTHLQTVFNSLSINSTDASGFSTASFGNSSNGEAVYGLFLCRGDIDSTGCRDCVTEAVSDLQQKYCPRVKVAYIWYDYCMVRYSNESFFGQMQVFPNPILSNTQNVTGNLTHFTQLVGEMMINNVSSEAASNSGSGRKKFFATGTTVFSSFQQLYGLGQCTQDLTSSDCAQCLGNAISQMPIAEGAQVLLPSCNVRYEIYPFFSSPAPPPAPMPVNTTGSTTSNSVTQPHHGKKLSTGVVVAIFVPSVTIIVVLLVWAAFLVNKKAKKYDGETVQTGEDFSAFGSLNYDLGTLQSATNNFSEENKLGEGGFGCVYKGTLPNGYEIAVKKLSMNSGQGVAEFVNEASLVAKLQHRNLVRLIGFCLDGKEKLLIYEYVPNRSLDKFLFVSCTNPEKRGQLSWEQRYKIIRGIARGMLYLHQDSQLKIIHRDLKAGNILLDADMNPKISDFGMARILGLDQTQANTERVVGTYGYMSPEYGMHGMFSVKSDVYSFGILVLEIISGMRNSSFEESLYEDLLDYAWRTWGDRAPLEFVDSTIRDSCSTHEVMRCLHLGLLCVQESIDMRPTMGKIVLTLDSYSVTLPMPQQPGLIVKSKLQSYSVGASSSDHSSNKLMPWSVNDITISEVDAR